MNIILKVATICVICIATSMSGCMETTTTTEYGEVTYNPMSDRIVIEVDTYEGGLHITGTEVYDGNILVRSNCNVDGYIDGCHVTGTMSRTGDGDICWDLYMKVDRYDTDGSHMTGYKTLKGCGDDVEWYSVLVATKGGYKTLYLNGYSDAEWRT